MVRWQGRKSDTAQPLAAIQRGQLQSSYCARSLRWPQALQYVCQHRSAASQSKNSNADTRGCTQNTQMKTGPRLCQLPNVGNPRRTIKRVAHGVSAAPDHLRALRASAYICAKSFLVPRCHRSRDAGRDHQRSRPVAASSVAALKSEGKTRRKDQGNQTLVGVLPKNRGKPRGFLGLVIRRFTECTRSLAEKTDSVPRRARMCELRSEAPIRACTVNSLCTR